jgi:hypothetical protein
MIPLKTSRLIKQYITKIRNNDNHHLEAVKRLNIYKSFGVSRFLQPRYDKIGIRFNYSEMVGLYKNQFINLTIADYAICWLAIVTVKKVLYMWDSVKEQTYLGNGISPKEILEIAENLLKDSTLFDKSFTYFINDVNMSSNIKKDITYNTSSLYDAASSALGTVLCGLRGLEENSLINSKDDEITDIYGDFASEAVKAFSCIDKNKPGGWYQQRFWSLILKSQPYNKRFLDTNEDEQNITEEFISDDYWSVTDDFEQTIESQNYKPLEFDSIKRLEFWEWWLTEAIPQAWELAEKSVAGQK